MFKSLKASNFFSWTTLEFPFSKGITLITGQNKDDNTSEGSGKSSILNALSWVLYGQIPSKEITLDEVIKEGSKGCSVEVILDSGETITRTRSPNDLYILNKDGKKVKGKDVKETQKQITHLLGMSFETFTQSVYFAQNFTGKFIIATQEEKVRVLSEIQDLTWCDKASKRSYELYKEISLEINKLSYELKQKEECKSLFKGQIHTYQELNLKWEEDINAKKTSLSKKMEENRVSIEDFKSKLTQCDVTATSLVALQTQIKTLEEDLNQLNILWAHINALKDQYNTAKNAKECPTCLQPICREVVEPVYPEQPEKVLSLMNLKKKEMVDLKGLLTQSVEKQSLMKQWQFQINYLTNQNLDSQIELAKLNASTNVYTIKSAELEKKLIELEQEVNTLQTLSNLKYKECESLKILKDGFKDLKSHVFKSLLIQLNYKANKYAQELFDMPVSISFTNVSEEDEISKIVTSVRLDGHERSLGLLSGGQFRRVQIATDFALSEIVSERRGNPMNIRILDEPFKDLSDIKIEKIVSLLEKMKGCTLIIEHNNLIKSIVNNTFHVTLVNGTSYSS